MATVTVKPMHRLGKVGITTCITVVDVIMALDPGCSPLLYSSIIRFFKVMLVSSVPTHTHTHSTMDQCATTLSPTLCNLVSDDAVDALECYSMYKQVNIQEYNNTVS